MNLQVFRRLNDIPAELLNQISKFDDEKLSDYFDDPYTFNIGVVTGDSDEVLGFGIIRVVNEFKMSLLPSLTNRKKAQLIKELLNSAFELRQCGEILVMITKGGVHYENFLKRHFNFEEAEGTPMKLEV